MNLIKKITIFFITIILAIILIPSHSHANVYPSDLYGKSASQLKSYIGKWIDFKGWQDYNNSTNGCTGRWTLRVF